MWCQLQRINVKDLHQILDRSMESVMQKTSNPLLRAGLITDTVALAMPYQLTCSDYLGLSDEEVEVMLRELGLTRPSIAACIRKRRSYSTGWYARLICIFTAIQVYTTCIHVTLAHCTAWADVNCVFRINEFMRSQNCSKIKHFDRHVLWCLCVVLVTIGSIGDNSDPTSASDRVQENIFD